MTRGEKVGLMVIIGVFVLLCAALVLISERPASTHSPADSPIIRQRIINLEKGN
jgi:hypothetical protein